MSGTPAHWVLDIDAPATGLALRLHGSGGGGGIGGIGSTLTPPPHLPPPPSPHLTLPALLSTSAIHQSLSIPGIQSAPVASMQAICAGAVSGHSHGHSNTRRNLAHILAATPPPGARRAPARGHPPTL